MNSTNLRRIDGGDLIKQGDSSSVLSFELLDENNQPIDLTGKEAIVSFETYSKEVFFRKTIEIEGQNKVSFTIDRILPPVTHKVEIKAEGYVFPSDNEQPEIKVVKGHSDYISDDELKQCTTEEDVIKLIKEHGGGPIGPEGKSAYDLWLELGNEGTIEDFLSSLIGRDGKTAYEIWLEAGNTGTVDDFLLSLKGESGNDGKDGIPGRDGVDGRDGLQGPPGADGKSAYQIWLDLGNVGSEQDFLDSLKAEVIRHAPTSWTLDRTSTPWTIWFDNGNGLQFPTYPTTETVYGYGAGSGDFLSQSVSKWPLAVNVIRSSNGSLSINNWKSSGNGYALYWADTTTVINPLQDASKFDFANAFYFPEDTDNLSLIRQKNVIRVMFELGVWSETDILDLGAVSV